MQGTRGPSDIFTPTPHSSRTESEKKNETYVTVTKNVKIFPLQESGSLFVKFWFISTLFCREETDTQMSTAYSGVNVVSDEPYLHNR